MRLLLVEDDPMIGEAVCTGLRQDGFAVDWVKDGQSAELALDNDVYDLLLLDLGLPRKGGLEVLASQRRRGSAIPVLILTARDAVADRVKGLDMGADDYLVKPFDLDELGARIRALLRRRSGRASPVIEVGKVRVHPATHEVFVEGRPVELSGREFALLQILVERPGSVLSRSQLFEKLYGWDQEVESNTIEVYIHGLRRKLGQQFIRNVRGVGYTVPKNP
jgi:two-component system response regulator QseB